MPTVTHSLLGLLETLESRIENSNTFPINTVCNMANDVVVWSKSVDLGDLDFTPCNIFSQIMTLVSKGMTGKSVDAESTIRSIKASLPVFKGGLRTVISKAS